MGTWGVKIFQNDDACDIRDTYREKLIAGATDSEAEALTIREFSNSFEQQLWIPLAVTQWKVGRLSNSTKQQALQAIDEELRTISEYWKPNLIEARTQELVATYRLLTSEMPNRKKLKLPAWAWKCPWSVGSVLQFKVLYPKVGNDLYEKYVLLLLVGISDTPKYKIPCEAISVALYNWYGDIAPVTQQSELRKLTLPLVDFVTKNGEKKKFHYILPTSNMRLENELKCVSRTPLSAMPEDTIPMRSPMNSTFDEMISRTLCTG